MLEKKDQRHSSSRGGSDSSALITIEDTAKDPLYSANASSGGSSKAADVGAGVGVGREETSSDHGCSGGAHSYKSSYGSNSEMKPHCLQYPDDENIRRNSKTSSSSFSSLGKKSKTNKDSHNSLEDLIAEEPLLHSSSPTIKDPLHLPSQSKIMNIKGSNGFYQPGLKYNSKGSANDDDDSYFTYNEKEDRRIDSPIFDYKSDDDNDDIPIIPGLVMNMSSDMDSAFEDESDEKLVEDYEGCNNLRGGSRQRRRFASKPSSPPRNGQIKRHFRTFSSDYPFHKSSNYNGFGNEYRNGLKFQREEVMMKNSPNEKLQMVIPGKVTPEASGSPLNVTSTIENEQPSIERQQLPTWHESEQFVSGFGNDNDRQICVDAEISELNENDSHVNIRLDNLQDGFTPIYDHDLAGMKLKSTGEDSNANDPGQPGCLLTVEEEENDVEKHCRKRYDATSETYDNPDLNLNMNNNNNMDTMEYEIREVAPDGGWGWFVLAGSILVNILIPGTVKSFGVLFVEFIEVFKATPSSASWIPAISYFLYSSTGPFASALAIKYSHRAVTVAGGILASVGLMSSYFATSISYLYVSYGIIGGLGAGLAYPIGVFMVARYFERRRGLANGLCTSGSALGSVLVPPLLRFLLGLYGYRGAILIMGAILLNVCLAAIFYSPVEQHMKKVLVPKVPPDTLMAMEEVPSSMQPVVSNTVTNSIAIGKSPKPKTREVAASMPIAIPLPPFDTRCRDSGSIRRATFQIGNETPGESWSLKSGDSGGTSPTRGISSQNDSLPLGSSPRICVTSSRARHIPHESTGDVEGVYNHSGSGGHNPSTYLSSVASRSRLNLTAIPEDDDTATTPDCTESHAGGWTSYSNLNSAKQQIVRSSNERGSQLLKNFSQASNLYNQPSGLSRTLSVASNVSNSSFRYMSTIHHGSTLTAMQYDTTVPDIATSVTVRKVGKSCWNCLIYPTTWFRKCCPGRKQEITRSTTTEAIDLEQPLETQQQQQQETIIIRRHNRFIDFSLLNDRLFIIMILSSATTAIGYTNFIILLPSYALKKGYDKSQASLLLSVVALLDFVGRIGGAALTDLHFLSRKWFFVVGLFMSGLTLAFLSLAESYEALATFCAAFGLASGTYVGLQAVILADRLGPEKLGSSYGITLFVNGIVQLLGPPICGNILEETDAFEPIFVGLGLILLFGSAIWLLLPCIDTNPPLYRPPELQIELVQPLTGPITTTTNSSTADEI